MLRPTLPLLWPIAPCDFLWLATWPGQGLAGFILLCDFLTGHPEPLRWLLAVLAGSLSARQQAWLPLGLLLWYWWLGPAYSWLSALSIAIQGSLWLNWIRADTASSSISRGWGWGK